MESHIHGISLFTWARGTLPISFGPWRGHHDLREPGLPRNTTKARDPLTMPPTTDPRSNIPQQLRKTTTLLARLPAPSHPTLHPDHPHPMYQFVYHACEPQSIPDRFVDGHGWRVGRRAGGRRPGGDGSPRYDDDVVWIQKKVQNEQLWTTWHWKKRKKEKDASSPLRKGSAVCLEVPVRNPSQKRIITGTNLPKMTKQRDRGAERG